MSSSLLGLFRTVAEDLSTHGGDATRPGFQALAVHRFGRWKDGIKTKIVRAPLTAIARTAHVFVRNFYGIELPFSAQIGRRVVFEHQHGIVVHGNSVIGDDCIIRQGVTLGIRRMDRLTEAPVLGRGVSVGAGAKILGDVTIGDHSAIGANAVVLDNVSSETIVAGIPARPIRKNYPVPENDNASPAKTYIKDYLDEWCTCSDGYTRKIWNAENLGFRERCSEKESNGVQCELQVGHDGPHACNNALNELIERSATKILNVF